MENLNVNISPENGIITVLQGEALKLRKPTNVNIKGGLNSPLMYLEKRITELNQKLCNIQFNVKSATIQLTVNESGTAYADPDTITGLLTKSDELESLRLNSGVTFTAEKLGDFIRMNRHYFSDKSTANELSKNLLNLKAKVEKQIEQTKDQRANFSNIRKQAVESNIPESFVVNIPVFNGLPKQLITIEIFIDSDLQLSLICPELNQLISEICENEIFSVLEKITEIAPDIVIIRNS